MSLLKAKSSLTREKRFDTLNALQGTLASFEREFSTKEPVKRTRTFSQSSHDDLLHALRLLAGIRESVIVIHGSRGCAAAGLFYHLTFAAGRWIVTSLDERDTIMGADLKLRKAVTEAHKRYKPELIFIVATPVVAINNDDIQSVVDELHEALDVDIIPLFVTGFASHHAVTGYDIALHALLKYLGGKRIEHPADNRINLLSVAGHNDDQREAERLLSVFGFELNTLPDGASAKTFRQAQRARLSISLDDDSSNYMGICLQDEYGVPYVEAPRPIGLGATGRWLAAAGGELGLEEAAQTFHVQECKKVKQSLGDFTLKGVRVYLGLSAATLFSARDLVEELGGEVIGITFRYIDHRYKHRLHELALMHPALPIHVADGQPFEEVNIIKRLSPDLYLGDAAHLSQIGRLGIPVVSLEESPILGYNGLICAARRFSAALRNRSFTSAIARSPSVYQDAWLRRSPNWHIKMEVK